MTTLVASNGQFPWRRVSSKNLCIKFVCSYTLILRNMLKSHKLQNIASCPNLQKTPKPLTGKSNNTEDCLYTGRSIYQIKQKSSYFALTVGHSIKSEDCSPTSWIKMLVAGSSTWLVCHGLDTFLSIVSSMYFPGTRTLAPLLFADWSWCSGREVLRHLFTLQT